MQLTMCKIDRHILKPVQNLPFTAWYIERALNKSPYKKSFLHMAITGSSTTQTMISDENIRKGWAASAVQWLSWSNVQRIFLNSFTP
jgi:hypothetical protein